MAEPVVIQLKHPIEFGKETIEELQFRRGKVGDLDGIELSESIPVSQLVTIAGRLCGRPKAVIDRLDEEDAGEVLQIALGFIGRCLKTGAPLSS